MTTTSTTRTRSRSSRLFTPYRAIGCISDGAPFGINRLGEVTFITTTVGNAFQVFEADKLRLAIVAPPLIEGGKVVGIQNERSRTFIATEKRVQVWDRAALVAADLFSSPTTTTSAADSDSELSESLLPKTARIINLLRLGNVLLVLTNEGQLFMFDTHTLEALEEGEPLRLGGDFRSGGVLVHPDTYLNKVLVGDAAGRLTLWNIRSRKLVHELKLAKTNGEDGEGEGEINPAAATAAVTALEASPAIDVVAVGRADGTISLVNLRYDKVLFQLRQDRVPITSLSFRTDASAVSQECPMLVSGGHDGQIYVWDLKTQRLHSVIKAAHEGPVSRVYFFPREPLLVSSSRDNSLKMWIFDAADGTARLLKSREGHTQPPRRIRYYGDVTEASMGTGANAEGCQILSAGSDRALRVFHTARDAQSREMSQGPLLKKAKQMHVRPEDLKLPPILSFAATETRARDWCNVITCHEGDCNAYVWKFDQRALGKVVLRQPEWEGNEMTTPDLPERHALAVAITACGNYGLVGTRGGIVYLYNMQSGAARGAFPKGKAHKSTPHQSMLLERGQARPGSVWAAHRSVMGNGSGGGESKVGTHTHTPSTVALGGHDGPVTGVQVDSLNQTVATAGLDGTLRFWDFKTHALVEIIKIGVGVAQLEQARDSELLAAACDDFVVRVYDVTTRKLVRRLTGHTAHISDLCFSRDGRRLVSASVDATVRVWDLPTGMCVDWLKFKRPVTGVSLSHTGEYLATSHVDRVGLYLWADRSFFQHVDLGKAGPPKVPCEVDEPTPVAEVGEVVMGGGGGGGEEEGEGEEEEEEEEEEQEGRYVDPMATRPKKEGLITLAMLPRAHWQTLFQLELIKARNKPKEPPKAPPRAPFFLPTMHPDGVNPVFAPPPPSAETDAAAPPAAAAVSMDSMAQAWSDDDDDNDGQEEDAHAHTHTHPTAPPTVSSALNAGVLPIGSRILKQPKGTPGHGKPSRSRLATLLLQQQDDHTHTHTDDDDITRHLMNLGPPQVDLEMQALCLGIFDEDGLELLRLCAGYLTRTLTSRRYFEVVQAYLSRFLQIYAPVLMEAGASVRGEVEALRLAQVQVNRQMKELVQHNLCLLGFFSNLKGI